MSLQSVDITELDGAIGVLPDGRKIVAIAGVADAGPIATPAAFAKITDVEANFQGGPLVHAVCDHIQRTGEPALVVRTGNTVVGTHTDINVVGVTGTSVVTITPGDTNPNDDYEPYFKVVAGGTIGVAGITFQWSLDGGRTLSPVTALGVANAFVFPGSGGIGYSFAAGTLNAGDVVFSRATAPKWNTTEIAAAIAAAGLSAQPWECIHIVGPIDATDFDTIQPAVAALKDKLWIGNTRIPNVAESEATYLSSLNTAFAAKSTTIGALCAGACHLTSASDSRKYLRPVSMPLAPLLSTVSEEIDISAPVSTFVLDGVAIRDSNGNPVAGLHDEAANPGLDDARFTVLRTWDGDGVSGVFCNNPRLFSPAGSDFEFTQHRRVMNLARFALRRYFIQRLSQPVLVNATTGFILEQEAQELEAGADAALRAVLMQTPKASGGGQDGKRDRFVKVSRTDNILSTKLITVQASVIPLAYPKRFTISLGFKNPAVVTV